MIVPVAAMAGLDVYARPHAERRLYLEAVDRSTGMPEQLGIASWGMDEAVHMHLAPWARARFAAGSAAEAELLGFAEVARQYLHEGVAPPPGSGVVLRDDTPSHSQDDRFVN